MKTSSPGDPAVTLPNPQHAIVLLHPGKARRINSILTPQDTSLNLIPAMCSCRHLQSPRWFLMRSCLTLSRKQAEFFGEGEVLDFPESLDPPTVWPGAAAPSKMNNARFSASFTCRCCSSLLESSAIVCVNWTNLPFSSLSAPFFFPSNTATGEVWSWLGKVCYVWGEDWAQGSRPSRLHSAEASN